MEGWRQVGAEMQFGRVAVELSSYTDVQMRKQIREPWQTP